MATRKRPITNRSQMTGKESLELVLQIARDYAETHPKEKIRVLAAVYVVERLLAMLTR